MQGGMQFLMLGSMIMIWPIILYTFDLIQAEV